MTSQSVFFNFLNFLVGALVIACGVLRCMGAVAANSVQSFPDFVVGAYEVLFGAIIIIIELAVPLMVAMYAGFMHTFFGKSMAYLFLGVLVMGPPDVGVPSELFRFIAGVFICFIALLYFIFHFISSIERPRAMFYNPEEPKA